MNSNQHFHPFFSQETILEDHAFVQDPLVFSTLNMGSCRPSKTELSNSFLDLLSGPSNNHEYQISQLSKSTSAATVSKYSTHVSGNVYSGVGCEVPIKGVAVSSEHCCNDIAKNGAEFSSFYSSRPISTSTCSWAPVLPHTVPVAGSNFHCTKSGKLCFQALQGNESERPMLPLKQEWSSINGTPGTSQHHIQNLPKVPMKAKSTISYPAPSLMRGGPRVSCMGTVGELFVSDKGLLGVFCLCHNLLMSVAKFCEHSGLHSGSPGNAVHLENGETIAEWRKLFFLNNGIRVSDRDGWEWSDGILRAGGLMGFKACHVINSIKNSDAIQPQQSGAIGGTRELANTYTSSYHPNMGQTSLDKLLNKVADVEQLMNSPKKHDPFLKSFMGLTQSGLPVPFNSLAMQGIEEKSVTMCKSSLDKGLQNSRHQLVPDRVHFSGKGEDPYISYPSSGTLKSFSGDLNIRRGGFACKAPSTERDAAFSNIELRLGQPSQQVHTFAISAPETMRPQQVEAQFDSVRPQLNQLRSQNSVVHRESEGPRQNIWCSALESSTSNQYMLQHSNGSANVNHSSDYEENRANIETNSLISLFLSQLGTCEGNKGSQTPDTVVLNNEHLLPGELDVDSLSAKCISSNFSKSTVNAVERKLDKSGPKLANQFDKGKELRSATDNESYNAVKANSGFQTKHMVDSRCSSEVVDGDHVHIRSALDTRPYPCLHQSSGLILDAHDAWSSDHFGKAPYFGKVDYHDDSCLRSVNSVPSASATRGFIPSTPLMGLYSTGSIYTSNGISSLPNKQNIDVSQHFLGENSRCHALRHMVESSKECSLASHEMNPQQGTQCCPGAMGMQRKGDKEDMMASDELLQGSYCCIKQDSYKYAVESLPSCLNFSAGAGIENSDDKTGIISKRKCCNHATSLQGVLSGQHVVQCPPCRVCSLDEQPLLRLRRFQCGKLADSEEHEMYSQNAHRPISCGCSVVPRCLTGYKKRRGHSEAFKEHNVCGKSQVLLAPAYDIHTAPQDGDRVADGQFNCPKDHVILNNDCLWRDVPSKLKGNPFAKFIETSPKVLQPSKNIADQLTDAVGKEFDGTCQEAQSLKEQQVSNVYSGCSAAAVTEVSVEINNLCSSSTVYGGARENDSAADEGSETEKCGSSDEVYVNKKSEDALTGNCMHPIKGSYCIPHHSSRDIIDEVNLENTSKLNERRNQFHAGHMAKESRIQRDPKVWITKKRNRSMKWKRLDASGTASELSPIHSESPSGTAHSELKFSSSNGMVLSLQPENVDNMCIYSHKIPRVKRMRSSLSAPKSVSWQRVKDTHNMQKNGYQMQSIIDGRLQRMPKFTAGKKAKQFLSSNGNNQIIQREDNGDNVGRPPKYISLGGLKSSSSHEREPIEKKVRPVVCGNSGIIINGVPYGQPKPAKIVSLSLILKYARRCPTDENERDSRLTSNVDTKKSRFCIEKESCIVHAALKKQEDKKVDASIQQTEINPSSLNRADRLERGCFKTKEGSVDELSVKLRRKNGRIPTIKSGIHHGCLNSKLKSRSKETHKCSLSVLTGDEHASKLASLHDLGEHECSTVIVGIRGDSSTACSKNAEFSLPKNSELLESSRDNGERDSDSFCRNIIKCSGKRFKRQASPLDSYAFCCVCGSSDKDEANHLLECHRCFIRVHQACYGVSRIPKGRWCCRPCRTNSKNVACVICGYEGGAMTRALRTRNIVKSLLKVWKVGTESECMKSSFLFRSGDDLGKMDQSARGEASDFDILESIPSVASKVDPKRKITTLRNTNSCQNAYEVDNSITAGVLDPTVSQWVHMVCGLWTPGTRCPNVDTMSAFDVSCVSPTRKSKVCSICRRSGGSCIKCRVADCSVHFHPWCAHQKGLLQSEVEGIDNEKVGFYGRCVVHATHRCCRADSPANLEVENARTEGFTCARIQRYKGRKREEGFCHNFLRDSSDSGGPIVPQEQINAWLHINGQKPCTRELRKLPASDSEYDCRREYARYKQAKGWKQLVVYKSGIHALGLYTSQFISCGAMVVEYVGEIVGLRVADKRETEYQSDRKLQYKSACYFFRIDKEHIIDATRKGGIARFVNHSCLVVFFAERDINPGEEITYDYHFNHEDEGKKIPCFCKSKNCRRYLN